MMLKRGSMLAGLLGAFGLFLSLPGAAIAPAQAQSAGAGVKLGIVSFLTGPAASPHWFTA